MIGLLKSNLGYHWRSHLGVLLGSALAAAVLTGSLLVGDSVDGSLRKHALLRLGNIQAALYTPNRFFSANLSERVSSSTAALQLRGMALAQEQQVNRVQVIGCTSNFWTFAGLDFQLLENEIALNQKLATALHAEVGADISLRIEKPGLLPRDAPLSEQNADRSVRARFKVARILGEDELGRFSLSVNQVVPYNAFVNFQWLEERTDREGKANLILTSCNEDASTLSKLWNENDFGFRFREEGEVLQLESEEIYLEPEAARAALTIPGAQGTLTYLVNSISKGAASTPYSFVLAETSRGLSEGEMVVNRWLADALECGVGDTVSMTYYELLSSGAFEERVRDFKVHAIVEMAELETERRLAPAFPGLSDVDRCSDWDVGIPMEQELLEDEANEAYWNAYKQMPKAIVSLKDGQAMWANRFGRLTSVRWPKGAPVESAFRAEFDPAAAGYRFQPVREQALAAVDQAMDFGQLFVGMSFFLIIAALMLTGLLFVFGVQQRAEEMGILLAIGWRPSKVRNLLLQEGAVLAATGSVLGSVLGIGYTRLLIAGLSNHWKGAIAHAAIEPFVFPSTIVAGIVVSFICAMSAMAIAVWRQARHPVQELLAADFTAEFQPLENKKPWRLFFVAAATGLAAVGVVVYIRMVDVQRATLPFFGAGALLLISGILFCGGWLRTLGRQGRSFQMKGLALRNAGRRRGRSLAVIGLLACGTFLVFAVSSMKEDVAAHADQTWAGTGGFGWFGESTLPLFDDLGGVRLRVRDGDDASCLNLNRAQSPRLLGVDPAAMSARRAFFAREDIWERLQADLPDGMVPGLVGDSDTAMWGLEVAVGVEKGAVLDYTDEAGNQFKVKLVGMLPMRLSVFQGTVLIAERDFVERFPAEEGYRMFLLNAPVDGRRYERAGLDVVPAVSRLREFYAVESTYLAMFLVLGILGLLVGSVGMGVTVLRNVQDRRAELALLKAVGFRAGMLRRLLFMEHGLLLAAGLGIGIVSAAVAMVPALFISSSKISVVFLGGLALLVAVGSSTSMALAVLFSIGGSALGGLRNE